MKALATFIMKGRTQAVMAASVFMVLALIITPLGIFSAAVIGLVTLRYGLREGLLVSLLGMAALAALGFLLFGQPLALPSVITEAERNAMVEEIAPWMSGGLAAAWFLQLTLALFLARSWQALLYHPGGFAQEFRELRLGYWLLILVPGLLLSGMLSEQPGLLAQGALVGMAAFFLQGVAVVHGLVARLKAGPGWLIGFYLLLVIGMPASFTLVSAAGFADGLVNFRARVRARDPKQGDE